MWFQKMLVSKEKLVSDFLDRIKIYDVYEESSMLTPTVPQGIALNTVACLILLMGKFSGSFCVHV